MLLVMLVFVFACATTGLVEKWAFIVLAWHPEKEFDSMLVFVTSRVLQYKSKFNDEELELPKMLSPIVNTELGK